jgi:hypothetical protein
MPIRHKSIKLVREDRLKKFMDRPLIEALHHPIREHILAVLNERIASPVEIGDEIELDVSAFHKQIEFLEERGLIELVDEGPPGRTSRHFYRATATTFFDDEVWKEVPASVKVGIDVSFIREFVNEAWKAMKRGTFHAHVDKHANWSPMVLDRRGWKEAMRLLRATLLRLVEIQRRSSIRMLRSGEPGIPTTIAIFGFEASPDYKRPPRPPFSAS